MIRKTKFLNLIEIYYLSMLKLLMFKKNSKEKYINLLIQSKDMSFEVIRSHSKLCCIIEL